MRPSPYCLPLVRVHVVDPSAYTPPYDHALCCALAALDADVDLFTSRFAYGPLTRPRRVRPPRVLLPCRVWRPRGAGAEGEQAGPARAGHAALPLCSARRRTSCTSSGLRSNTSTVICCRPRAPGRTPAVSGDHRPRRASARAASGSVDGPAASVRSLRRDRRPLRARPLAPGRRVGRRRRARARDPAWCFRALGRPGGRCAAAGRGRGTAVRGAICVGADEPAGWRSGIAGGSSGGGCAFAKGRPARPRVRTRGMPSAEHNNPRRVPSAEQQPRGPHVRPHAPLQGDRCPARSMARRRRPSSDRRRRVVAGGDAQDGHLRASSQSLPRTCASSRVS